MTESAHIESARGASLRVHDFGGDGPPLLLAHATGFHGLVWGPAAARLTPEFHVWSWDFRGHGDSPPPNDESFRWDHFADDVITVVDHVREAGGARPLAIGHSKGAASLVLAELDRPSMFRALYLYEPVIFPPAYRRLGSDNPMVTRALKRRADFPDADAAIANYSSKPPLDALRDDVLRSYVEHGFRPDANGITLKCRPEYEAAMYDMGSRHDAWDRLGELSCPVRLAAGRVGQFGPEAVADLVAERMPNCALARFERLGHFGPLEDPAFIADDAAAFFRSVA